MTTVTTATTENVGRVEILAWPKMQRWKKQEWKYRTVIARCTVCFYYPETNHNMTWSKFDNYLLLLVHDSMLRHYMLSEIRLSVCPSVCASHGWISWKQLNLGSCYFHHTVAASLSCMRYKFHPEIPTGSPEWGRQTRVGWENELILSLF